MTAWHIFLVMLKRTVKSFVINVIMSTVNKGFKCAYISFQFLHRSCCLIPYHDTVRFWQDSSSFLIVRVWYVLSILPYECKSVVNLIHKFNYCLQVRNKWQHCCMLQYLVKPFAMQEIFLAHWEWYLEVYIVCWSFLLSFGIKSLQDDT